ncbi:ABC transporter substrate-binding protein [Burkholderia dolosa]|uniref:ABC transporter substrate-binding protein n=1 Tax=Burkholderia dolosa TaxID=152500 RepID=UPI0015927387|nr:ABC transporter substrate-binding protein [Burkholderia dolosa]MBR8302392.1 ABC transporter substrate-binding protein [Burkholderia dolosa]MBR8456547.1 ABC transporter substrate-binding protein [Burkholderia dolosa]MDN7424329.1 ABC transporter substrate-binding protein [Burkholderia dolosa]
MREVTWRQGGLRSVLALTTIVVSAASFAAEPIQIGATVPLTSALSLTGQQCANAMKLAEEDIDKAGGVNGRKLKFVFEDAMGSNSAAVNAFVKVVQQYKPPFAMVTSYSTQNAAVSPEVAKAKIPVMYAGGADILSNPRNPWMFRIRPRDGIVAVAMAQFAKNKLQLKRPGILYVQNDFGQGGANAVSKVLAAQGVNVVGQEAYGQNDKDMSAQILSLKNKGADGFIAFVYPQDGALLLRQMKALGIQQPLVTSSSGFVPAATQLLDASDFVNVWGVTDAALDQTEKGRDYLKRYKARFGVDSDPYGAAYYDGAMLLAKAIAEAGDDPVKLRDYLAKVSDYQGVAHKYKTDAQGNLVHDVAVVKMKPGTKQIEFVQSIAFD